MKIKALIVLFLLTICNVQASFAAELPTSLKIYMSNNKGEITSEYAYKRLENAQQDNLVQDVTKILQKKHIEQGSFEGALGAYTMSTDKKLTADNTAIFTSSPYQHVNSSEVFTIAQTIAARLKQDSVAVFIPSAASSSIGDVTITFPEGKQPSINEVINMIHQRLPVSYSNAFSIHLNPKFDDYTHRKVAGVEWLGSQENLKIIQKAFPQAKVNFNYGNAYLIYADGRVQPIV